jgi:hypothetical protein
VRRGRKAKCLLREVDGPPNRVAVLLEKHPEGEEEGDGYLFYRFWLNLHLDLSG